MTFVELFFDLVFVFAVTEVTHYAAHHLDGPGILRSIVVFWLMWWGWAQFTWALNAANTDHQGVRATTLFATGIATARSSVEHLLALAAAGLVAIVVIEQMTARRRLVPTKHQGNRPEDRPA